MVRARRDVVLGTDPPAELSHRAVTALEAIRSMWSERVDPLAFVLERGRVDVTYWSMAGLRAHETLAAALPVEFEARSTNEYVRFSAAFDLNAMRLTDLEGVLPYVDPRAVAGLKFSAALPAGLARATLAERFVDHVHASEVATAPVAVHAPTLFEPEA